MPKRTDIKSVLILGSGPIIIGQACEFDYSGVQACKALREEGYRIILINSNPATIMTDLEMADATYIEPIHWKIVRKIIEKERPDALLPTMGGQIALNCALDLERNGVLNEFNVIMIGITADIIFKAEDRRLFNAAMKKIGLDTSRSGVVSTIEEAFSFTAEIGFPCIIRPSFNMGGSGSGIAYNRKEFKEICERSFDLSPNKELLIDESLIGWKEYEMEMMRDRNDNCIVVCSIENFDTMGIHTGDSIAVAPAKTLTDKEYQIMRNASIAVLREIGIETGGSNVQFAINPKNGHLIVIEMNPRVSRSSALASKATGFPIAKMATKLAVGYTLDELMNDITEGIIPASFEPSIDYVVTKIPRFNFEKFYGANDRLSTQMKSVGEIMAIGRTQQESMQKALRSLEVDVTGFDPKVNLDDPKALNKIIYELKYAGAERIWYIADAFRAGFSVEKVFTLTNIDRWFLTQIEELINLETQVKQLGIQGLDIKFLRILKRKGFSDARLANLVNTHEIEIRKLREKFNLHPVYKRIDACSAEFKTGTAYMYSTYEDECESNPSVNHNKIMLLGGGPNRIGQSIEFDYCCVHASLALREDGYETIMVNCNPETVSTDYDVSNRLYFEPITLEDVLEIINIEKPRGVIVQYGGQTPLKLARQLEAEGIPIIGTKPDSINRTEDRKLFQQTVNFLKLKQPANATVMTIEQAIEKAKEIGYPLVVRPSYVLGGYAMNVAFDENDLCLYFRNAIRVSNGAPVLLDHFLEEAIEVDVDAICDGETVLIGGIMEHIEQAGIHSGDSACSLPAYTLNKEIQNIIRTQVKKLALELQIRGLMNVQFAVKDKEVYLIDMNPRAARTVPFVSKAIGVSLAKVAVRVMIGKLLSEQGITKELIPSYYSVKEAVFPFNKFPGADPVLGPEMRSTGEVMGIGRSFEEAFIKAQLGSNSMIKKLSCLLLSVCKGGKECMVEHVEKVLKYKFVSNAIHDTVIVFNKKSVKPSFLNKKNKRCSHVWSCIKNNKYICIIDTTSNYQEIEKLELIYFNKLRKKAGRNIFLNKIINSTENLKINFIEQVKSIQEIHIQSNIYTDQ